MKARFAIVLVAIAMLCACAMAQENTADSWYKKGQDLQRNDSSEEALKAFDKAIEQNQSYAFAWSGKGSALFSMGKYEEAIAAWDRAIAIEHDEFFSGSLWEMIGNALEILGKKNESASAYRKALELADQAVTKQNTPSDLNLSAAWGLKGILLDDQGMYEEAIEAYDNAAKANPKDAFVLPAKGEILADKLGRYNESLNVYNRSLEIDPKSLGALRGMGSALTSLGRYNEAIKYFDKAIEIDSGFARAWAGKGEALRNLGKYNESIQAYDKSIELLPQQPQYALIGKGMALDSLGRHEEATRAYNETLKDYNRTIEKNPRNAEVMYNEGNALRGLGRYNESIQAYEKAIELNPRYIDAWQGKGYALKALGRNSEADASFAKAKKLGALTVTVTLENIAGCWIKKGNDLVESGSFEEALTDYNKAIQLDPENLDAWDRKALILYSLDLQAYRRVLNLSEMRLAKNPQDARAWKAQSVALASLGRQEEANQSLKKALEIYDQEIRENPENATAWFYRAELTANGTEALVAYDKVIELNGSMKIYALITKGNILLNLGRSDEAIAVVDRAIEMDPGNISAWEEKALASYALGKYNESLRAYEKVIELGPENAFAWKGKGDSFKALERQTEADAAYAKAKDLRYQG